MKKYLQKVGKINGIIKTVVMFFFGIILIFAWWMPFSDMFNGWKFWQFDQGYFVSLFVITLFYLVALVKKLDDSRSLDLNRSSERGGGL